MFPHWAIPRIVTVGLDFLSVRGKMGGQARQRMMSDKERSALGRKAAKARLAKSTPEQRRAIAIKVGKARWANRQEGA